MATSVPETAIPGGAHAVKRLTMAVAAAVTVAGCALGPDYRRPETAVPDAYRWQLPSAEAGASAAAYADLGWWQVYADPNLQQLLKVAVEQNPDVRIAAARIDQARASLGVSRLAQLPQISATAGETRNETSALLTSFTLPRERTNDVLQLSASWEIDLWGRLRRATEAGRADLLAAEYAKQGVLVGLIGDVASAYFNLLSLDEQLEITQRTTATREKFVELTRARHDRGVVSGLDVATAEAQLATAQGNVPELQRQIAQAEDQLNFLLGGGANAIRRQTEAQPTAPIPPPGLPSALLERRPDIRQAEQALVAANARIGVAKAALFPTLSLTGAVGSASSALDGLLTGPAQTFSIGGNLLLPILDAQRNLFVVDLADARKREAILQYQKTIQGALRDVSDALVARQKYAEFELTQRAQVAALRRADDIALARYRAGFSSYFDVINADRDLFNAELTLSASARNTRIAAVQLYRALGGGWQLPEPEPAAAK